MSNSFRDRIASKKSGILARTTAGIAVAAAAISNNAEAAITYTATPSLVVSDFGRLLFNPLTGDTLVVSRSTLPNSNYPIGLTASTSVNFGTANSNFEIARLVNDNNQRPLNLGDVIDGNDSIFIYSGSTSLRFSFSSVGFAPFRVLNQGPGNDETFYGYAEVQWNGSTLRMLGYAISDTPGEGLFAGTTTAIPEPGVFSFTILSGLAGLTFRRRKKA